MAKKQVIVKLDAVHINLFERLMPWFGNNLGEVLANISMRWLEKNVTEPNMVGLGQHGAFTTPEDIERDNNPTRFFNNGYNQGYNQSRVDFGHMSQKEADEINRRVCDTSGRMGKISKHDLHAHFPKIVWEHACATGSEQKPCPGWFLDGETKETASTKKIKKTTTINKPEPVKPTTQHTATLQHE